MEKIIVAFESEKTALRVKELPVSYTHLTLPTNSRV